MSEFQKIIKYCAMAFAAFLAFSILTGIVTAVLALGGFLSNSPGKGVTEINKSFENVKSLSIEHSIGTLNIKQGSSNKVEVEAENVSEDMVIDRSFSGELRIKSKFSFWNILDGKNAMGSKSVITIYIPEDFVADKVRLDAGAGNIYIEALNTEKLDVNAGAGNINGSRIRADKVKLDGGVGDITFEDVEFSDTDIDSGVGNVNIDGNLYGKNKIDCGVGNVTLDLLQSPDDYDLTVDKGMGSIRINGEKYSNLNWNNRKADNSLDINGGVGNIDINFKE